MGVIGFGENGLEGGMYLVLDIINFGIFLIFRKECCIFGFGV